MAWSRRVIKTEDEEQEGKTDQARDTETQTYYRVELEWQTKTNIRSDERRLSWWMNTHESSQKQEEQINIPDTRRRKSDRNTCLFYLSLTWLEFIRPDQEV